MLHFVYKDALVEEELEATSTSSSAPCISDTVTAKLLSAADRYNLTRLRRLCESHLCKDISVNSVAQILALADRYHATELKAVCLRFAAENLAGTRRFIFASCSLLCRELMLLDWNKNKCYSLLYLLISWSYHVCHCCTTTSVSIPCQILLPPTCLSFLLSL